MIIKNATDELNRNSRIELGICGEFGSRKIEFDISSFAEYGAGSFELLYQRPGDFDPYVAEKTSVTGNTLTWEITADDTAKEGTGAAEIHLYSGDTLLAKSQTYTTFVKAALGEPPIATDMTTVDTVTAIAAIARGYMLSAESYAEEAAEKADYILHPPIILENGNWGLWNGSAYEDSGNTSVGEDGKSAYEYAVDGGYEDTEQQFYSDLGSIATKASEAEAAATAAEGHCEDAEAYAVGKRNGTDVPSEDPTYHNNAKYYANIASSAKDDAEAAQTASEAAQAIAEAAQADAESARDASVSAKNDSVSAKNDAQSASSTAVSSARDSEAYAVGKRNGADVASGDPAYHNNAKYYADQADSSKNSASTYASSASSAKDAAVIAKDSAQTSEDNAEAWAVGQRNGTDVGSSDPTYHNNAKYYSEQSASANTMAQTAKETAAQWATGSTSGTPSATNNSSYYASQSASSASDADDSAEDAEAWAVGQRDGVDVGSDDPTYENNAKYYAEQADAVVNGNFADLFDSTQDYSVGDYCIYNGDLYKFVLNHSGAWDADDVEQIVLSADVQKNTHYALNLYNLKTITNAEVASFSDGEDEIPVQELKVDIDPVQDLHGYAKPWAGGAGNNQVDPTKWTGYNGAVVTLVGNGFRLVGDGSQTYQAARILRSVKTYPPGTYHVKFKLQPGATLPSWARVCFRDANATIRDYERIYADTLTYDTTLTISADCFFAFIMNGSTGETQASDVTVYDIIVSETDVPYEPYSNVCPISGWTEAKVWVQPTHDATANPTVTIDLDGTRYGGTLNVTTGVLTVTDANIASYNGETLPGEWISDRDVYAAGTTPTTGAQVVYELATPQTYQLTPTEVKTLLGQNNIWCDTGNLNTLTYRKKNLTGMAGQFIGFDSDGEQLAIIPDAAPDSTSNNLITSKAVADALDDKVDKVTGKELSENDFTDTLKNKLDGIETGAQVNTITGVKGDSEESYRTGNVNIAKGDIGLENVDNTADLSKPVSAAQAAAINALYPHDTISDTAVASFEDGADGIPVRDLTIDIDAVQDLHGYDAPWAGGAGNNLVDSSKWSTNSTGVTVTPMESGFHFVCDGLRNYQAARITMSNQTFYSGITYYVKFKIQPGATLSTDSLPRICLRNSNNNIIFPTVQYIYADTLSYEYSISTQSDGYLAFISHMENTGDQYATDVTFYDFIISTTDVPYEPYANICPISGWTGANVWVDATHDTTANPTVTVSWQSAAGTVYGGTLDVTTGVLTVTHANIASYAGETINEPWISSMDVYAAGTTPTTGAQVVYPLTDAVTVQLTPNDVVTLLGQNYVWCDTGNATVDYRADPTLYINKKLEAL